MNKEEIIPIVKKYDVDNDDFLNEKELITLMVGLLKIKINVFRIISKTKRSCKSDGDGKCKVDNVAEYCLTLQEGVKDTIEFHKTLTVPLTLDEIMVCAMNSFKSKSQIYSFDDLKNIQDAMSKLKHGPSENVFKLSKEIEGLEHMEVHFENLLYETELLGKDLISLCENKDKVKEVLTEIVSRYDVDKDELLNETENKMMNLGLEDFIPTGVEDSVKVKKIVKRKMKSLKYEDEDELRDIIARHGYDKDLNLIKPEDKEKKYTVLDMLNKLLEKAEKKNFKAVRNDITNTLSLISLILNNELEIPSKEVIEKCVNLTGVSLLTKVLEFVKNPKIENAQECIDFFFITIQFFGYSKRFEKLVDKKLEEFLTNNTSEFEKLLMSKESIEKLTNTVRTSESVQRKVGLYSGAKQHTLDQVILATCDLSDDLLCLTWSKLNLRKVLSLFVALSIKSKDKKGGNMIFSIISKIGAEALVGFPGVPQEFKDFFICNLQRELYPLIIPEKNEDVIKLGEDGILKEFEKYVGMNREEFNKHLRKLEFLGEEEDFIKIIIEDTKKLQELELERTDLSFRLASLIEKEDETLKSKLKLKKTHKDDPFHPSFAQSSFYMKSDKIGGGYETTITNTTNNEKIEFEDMLPYFVRIAGFFGGKDTKLRLKDFEFAAKFLNLGKFKKEEKKEEEKKEEEKKEEEKKEEEKKE